MSPELESWYANLTEDQRALAVSLRRLIHAQEAPLREEIKWGQPCFFGKALVCYLQKAKLHVALGFGRGADLVALGAALQGEGRQMRHIRFALGTDPDVETLTSLLRAAIRIDANQTLG